MQIYPTINIERNLTPNRLYAVPIIGFLIKIVMLIPVFIFSTLVTIAAIIFNWINSFVVLFSGKYWKTSYDLTINLIRLGTKIYFFLNGLTDRYPGFDFKTAGFSVEIAMPTHPNRWFAFLLLGGLVRALMMIPYAIYFTVLQRGAQIGTVISSFPVLFNGRYPESTYEFNRDTIRVNQALGCFMAGLSDQYPSFSISMKHKNIKIALIIVGVLLSIIQFAGNHNSKTYRYQPLNYSNSQNR